MKWLGCVLCLLMPAFGMEGWETNEEAARQKAAGQKKDVLVVYRGEDWETRQSVNFSLMFGGREFMEAAGERYVLLELPFPDVPEKGEPQTAVMFTLADGRPFYAINWEVRYGLDWMMEELAIAQEKRELFLPVIDKINKRSGVEKYKLVERLGRIFPYYFANLYPPYREWFEEAYRVDEQNKSLFRWLVAHTKRSRNQRHEIFALMNGAPGGPGSAERAAAVEEFMSRSDALREVKQNMALDYPLDWLRDLYVRKMDADEFKRVSRERWREMADLFPGSKEGRMVDMFGYELTLAVFAFKDWGDHVRLDPGGVAQAVDQFVEREKPKLRKVRQALMMIKARALVGMGRVDESLELLRKARDVAPWSKNAPVIDEYESGLIKNRKAVIKALEQKQNPGDVVGLREVS